MPNIKGKVAALISQLDDGVLYSLDCCRGVIYSKLQNRLTGSGAQQVNLERIKSTEPHRPGGSESRYLQQEMRLTSCVKHLPEVQVLSLGKPGWIGETEYFDGHWKIVAPVPSGIDSGANLVERSMRLANAEV